MRVSELAGDLDFQFFGDDREIESVRYYDVANDNDITFVKSEKEFLSTKAKTVMMSMRLFAELDTSVGDKTCIVTLENLEELAISISEKLGLSLLFEFESIDGYFIEKGAIIDDFVTIEPGATIYRNAIIKRGCYISSGAKIGCPSFYNYNDCFGHKKIFRGNGSVLMGKNCFIGTNSVIERGTFRDTIIGENVKIGHLVIIGHDSVIGENSKIVTQTGIAGGARIGTNVEIYAQSGVSGNAKVGNNVKVLPKTGVHGRVKDGSVIFGIFGRDNLEELMFEMKSRDFFKSK